MTDRHARWLAERLPEWEREGLVSPEAARTLRERYREVPAAGLAQIVIGAIGGLFIGAGLIAVLAYNWDDLSRPARMTLAKRSRSCAMNVAISAGGITAE